MSRMTKWLVLGLTMFTLAACGKSDTEKAQDRAQNLKNEQNALVNDLNNSYPSTSWSHAELQAYENKLIRLQRVENELEAENGKNGVIVWGGNNSTFIQNRLELVRKIRAAKLSSVDSFHLNLAFA